MTAEQEAKREQLEEALSAAGKTLLPDGESQGYVFTLVDGVTVLITRKWRNPKGGYKVAALRTYPEVGDPTSLDAAVRAGELFERQDPDRTRNYGHRGPRVNYMDWRCGDPDCPCSSEPDLQRRMERSIGYRVRMF